MFLFGDGLPGRHRGGACNSLHIMGFRPGLPTRETGGRVVSPAYAPATIPFLGFAFAFAFALLLSVFVR